MRKLRILAVVLTLLAAAALCWYIATDIVLKDQSVPVISMDSDTIETSVEDADAAILEGVTAEDATDGDVSDSILVESISAFTGDKHRVITYAAFDSDNHVTHAARDLVYTDYHSPRFYLEEPLSFAAGSDNLLSGVTAQDMLDGDVTSEVRLVSDEEIDTSRKGTYSARLRVANSAGDVSVLPVTIEIYDSTKLRQPQISLTEYCVYVQKGADFDAASFLDSVEINGLTYSFVDGRDDTYHRSDDSEESRDEDTFGRSYAEIDDTVNTEEPGNYTVTYSVTAGAGSNEQTGSVLLYAVVEDDGQEAAQ